MSSGIRRHDDAEENRSGPLRGVATDYLTDKQLYERVGQADVVYIGRKPPDLLGLISGLERVGRGAS